MAKENKIETSGNITSNSTNIYYKLKRNLVQDKTL